MATKKTFRQKLAKVVFENDTKAGHWFDIIVLCLIVISVTFVALDTVRTSIGETLHKIFHVSEWVFTIMFTVEYLIRLYSAPNRMKYAFSFFGIVDFLAIVPSYISFFFTGTTHLLVIRVLRILRIFRIFQLGQFVREGSIVASALRASKNKIIVFLVFVIIASILAGALMYMVEADENKKINNIPEGIYWAIVTLTTIGYGDAVPVTPLGKVLASIVMILGYGVIAVPTGIVTAEISSRVIGPRNRLKIKCEYCGDGDHLQDSSYCHNCGTALPVAK